MPDTSAWLVLGPAAATTAVSIAALWLQARTNDRALRANSQREAVDRRQQRIEKAYLDLLTAIHVDYELALPVVEMAIVLEAYDFDEEALKTWERMLAAFDAPRENPPRRRDVRAFGSEQVRVALKEFDEALFHLALSANLIDPGENKMHERQKFVDEVKQEWNSVEPCMERIEELVRQELNEM